MDRYVMRHPDTAGVALIPESSRVLHIGMGWLRVSDAIAEEAMHGVDLDAYADAADLDAAPKPVEEPVPTSQPSTKPATSKEK